MLDTLQLARDILFDLYSRNLSFEIGIETFDRSFSEMKETF